MGGLFGSKPKPQPVQRMPDEEDPAVKEAKRRAAAATAARSGRTSTVLTPRNSANNGNDAPAAGGAYKNSFLGQAG